MPWSKASISYSVFYGARYIVYAAYGADQGGEGVGSGGCRGRAVGQGGGGGGRTNENRKTTIADVVVRR